MPLSHTVREVQTRAEFDAVMDCQWAGFGGEQDAFWDIWFPVDKTGHQGAEHARPDRKAAIDESRDRLWREHEADPHSRWFYIATTTTSAAAATSNNEDGIFVVAGSCQWRVYEPPTNPFPNGVPEISCPAWSGGSEGDRVTRWLAALIFTPRANWMARPHVGLSWMAVRPEYRRQGVGNALMEHGVRRADELGLESFIEASDAGIPLYTRFEFRDIERVTGRLPVLANNDDDDDGEKERRQIEAAYGLREGYTFTTMWRPPGGHWTAACDDLWRERLAKFSTKQPGERQT